MRSLTTFSKALAAAGLFATLLWLGENPAGARVSSSAPAIVVVASPSTTPPSAPEALDIAFDQIDRTIHGAGTPPPLNTFAQDAAAVDAYQSASLFPSSADIQKSIELSMAASALSFLPFGSTAASFAMAAQQRAMQRKMEAAFKAMSGPNPGTLTRFLFYHGWTRIETHVLVLIVRPDRHQRIYLIPANKTYRVEEIAAAAPSPSPEPEDSFEPNPAKVAATIVTSQADTATVEGQTATGFRSDASTTLTGGIDPCLDGTYTATQLEYFMAGSEPLPGTIPEAQAFYALTLPRDCYTPFAPQRSGLQVPYHQMYVYRLVAVVRNAALAGQPTPKPGKQAESANMMENMFGGGGVGDNYMLLSERGNIRQLTDADASLFDIPEGYTQAQTP